MTRFCSCLYQELRKDGAFLLRAAFVALVAGLLIATALSPVILVLRLFAK